MSPELNVAPSPSPVIAAQPPANTAANAGAARDNAPDAAAAGNEAADNQPFANVLQRQIKQYGDGKAKPATTAKAHDAILDLQAATGTQKDEQPTDELAALLPMLPGMASQVAASTEKGTGEDAAATDPKLAAGDAAQSIVVTAAPVTPAVVQQQAAPKATEGETTEAPVTIEAAKPAATPAILAADTAATEEATGASTKKNSGQESFENVLNQIRDMPAVSRPQHNEVKNTDAAANRVQAQVGTPAWNSEIGDRLTWMAGNKETKAELVLTPPQMGRIEISLSISGDQANASFVSANPEVREALESALPRLREILNEAGISLGQTQVGAESFQQSANNGQNGDNASRSQNGNGAGSNADTATNGFVATSPRQWLQRGNGLVDLFA